MKYFKTIDFHDISIESENFSKHKTTQGTLLSFAIILTSSILAIMFSSDLYKRANPFVTSSTMRANKSEIYMKEFPFLFSFISGNGNAADVYSLFDLTTTYFTVFPNGTNYRVSNTFTLQKCDLTKYHNYTDLLSTLSEKDYYCFNFDDQMKFSNSYLAVDSIFINLWFTYCLPENRSTCSKNVTKQVDDFFVVQHFPNSYVDPLDYQDPLKCLWIPILYQPQHILQ